MEEKIHSDNLNIKPYLNCVTRARDDPILNKQ